LDTHTHTHWGVRLSLQKMEGFKSRITEESSLEKRGFLFNESTERSDFFVLRAGLLRVYDNGSKGKCLKKTIHMAFCSEVNLLPKSVIEVRSSAPYVFEYVLKAASEEEAESWYTVIKKSATHELEKIKSNLERLQTGAPLYKYNYSNSKRTRRQFWITKDGTELCWAKKRDDDEYSRIYISECIGIIYGPMTTTFVRCQSIDDPAHCCFSLLFMGRTLDLATPGGDDWVAAWFLGLQYLMKKSTPLMGDSQFAIKKVHMKLLDKAHADRLTLGTYLLQKLRALGGKIGRTRTTRTKSGITNGSRSTASTAAPATVESQASSLGEESLKKRILALEGELREAKLNAALAELQGDDVPRADSENETINFLRRKCGELDAKILENASKVDQYDTLQARSEKLEAALRKMAKKLEKSEAAAQSSPLGTPPAVDSDSVAGAQGSDRGRSIAAQDKVAQLAELEEVRGKWHKAEAENKALQKQVKEQESRLNAMQSTSKDAAASADKHNAALTQKDSELSLKVSELARKESEVAQKDQLVSELRTEIAKLRTSERDACARLQKTQNARSSLLKRVKKLGADVSSLRKAQRALRVDSEDRIKGEMSSFFSPLAEAFRSMGVQREELNKRYKDVCEQRRQLHNLVLELKGNIRVFCRVRPMIDIEDEVEPTGGKTITFQEDTKLVVYNDHDARRKIFEFDRIFYPSSQQRDVFEEACPLATSVLDGFNVCIFAYGQTGSGKTYTMTGIPKDPGLNIRILRELFDLRNKKRKEVAIDISISVLEIYNEALRDLLGSKNGKNLEVKATDKDVTIPGLEEMPVNSVEEVLDFMSQAETNRSSGMTDMNEHSSRSHSIVTVKTKSRVMETNTIYSGKIHLIDLAGSENVNKSGVIGVRLQEAQNINKSLSALGDVMQSLQQQKSGHIPYRNSKLTMLLKDSLGGNSKTLMIVQASPAQSNVVETLSSLGFASRARQVELGRAKKNVVQS